MFWHTVPIKRKKDLDPEVEDPIRRKKQKRTIRLQEGPCIYASSHFFSTPEDYTIFRKIIFLSSNL